MHLMIQKNLDGDSGSGVAIARGVLDKSGIPRRTTGAKRLGEEIA